MTDSIRQRAFEAGLNYVTVQNRIKSGWPEEKWFIPVSARQNKNTITQKAKEANIPADLVYRRKANGWPEEDWYLPVTPRRKTERVKVNDEGIKIPKKTELAMYNYCPCCGAKLR
jgi:hypothetical protein